jgi:hypothetical protein
MSIQNHLIRVPLAELHPTQISVGEAEVSLKRIEWAAMKRKQRDRMLADHWFPAVHGPGKRYYIVDHHHLGLALLREKVESAFVMVLDDLSEVATDAFWRLMEFHRWAHPYDGAGKRRNYDDIPSRIERLRDDPYRSLAGFVRSNGGYAKDASPFSEFIWADFFRPLIAKKALKLEPNGKLPAETVQQAVALARGPGARHLPGWTGVALPSTPNVSPVADTKAR